VNLLDQAIGVVASRVALQRARSRVALELTTDYLERHAQRFRYDGAAAGRRAHGWYAASTDANVEPMGSLIWFRNRSRELIRNNPYAARAIEELAGNVVGTGIVPKAKTGNVALDKIIDAEWPFFADACDTPQRLDFYGMQTLTVRTMAESGEAIVRFRPRLADSRLRVPLQLQMLEADFLDQARTMGLINGHVMDGVQFDEDGRRTANLLFSNHRGGVLILNPRGGIVSQPVPADQIMHVYRVLRPGQVRGVPWLAPVMMALRDLDHYCDAERVRKKVEACAKAFVEQVEGIDGDPLGIPGTGPVGQAPVETFQPGMVEYLKPGQTARFDNPPPAGGYREYKMTELQGIMAGIGLPYELGTGDMSQVNYSSWRGGMLGFRNTVEAHRWLTLIPLFSMPVWRRFIDTLILQASAYSVS
jgi:lambda family phage portal protein